MFLGRVVGNVTATRKAEQLDGTKFLLILPNASDRKKPGEAYVVAADATHAGVGEEVIVATGRAARLAMGDDALPVDAAVVGIVDGKELRDA
jgi:ethanolamine utilization protein EutN